MILMIPESFFGSIPIYLLFRIIRRIERYEVSYAMMQLPPGCGNIGALNDAYHHLMNFTNADADAGDFSRRQSSPLGLIIFHY